MLTSQGLPPDQIVIGHLDDGEPDLDLIREIIARGAWAQFDDIGYEYYTERLEIQMTTDVVRARKLARLAEEGLCDQVILASDFGMQRHLRARGGRGWWCWPTDSARPPWRKGFRSRCWTNA